MKFTSDARAGSWGGPQESPIFRVTAAIADAVTPDEVYEALVDRVADAVGASSAGLWLVAGAGDGERASLVRNRGYSPSAVRAMEVLDLEDADVMPVLDCIRRGAPLWIRSQTALYESYPHLRALATAGRSYRVSCLPLVTHERVLGSLCLTIEQEGDAADAEKEFLLLVARYATQAIERVRLYEAERLSRAAADAAAARLQILNRASRAFAAAELDLTARLRDVAAELSGALDSCVNIGLIQPDGRLCLIAVHHPLPAAQAELQRLSLAAPLQLGEGVTGRLAETGASVILPVIDGAAIAAQVAPGYRDFVARYPTHTMMGVALRARGRVIGTVTATRSDGGESYGEADLQMLEELAERAAVAIENSRLYQESVEARTSAEQLFRFAEAVVAADHIDLVYEAAFDAIEAALGVRRAAILTFDEQKVMRFRAWRGLSETYRSAVEGHSPWATDATSPKPVIVKNALAEEAFESYAETFRAEGIGALAFFPLLARGRLLGKLMLYHDRPHSFSPRELEAVRAIGYHLGSVIARFTAWAQLEETVRSNELFAGALAHDLRSPIGSIVVAAQHLQRWGQGDVLALHKVAKPAASILASGLRMSTMIDQLLDFTLSRAGGGVRIERKRASLTEFCALALDELKAVHPEWRILCEADGDLVGEWDQVRLVQVVSNLVSNAGQHGLRGEPIRVKLDGRHPELVVVEVHNHGSIPPPMLPTLFDPFRTTRQRSGQASGLGLGLFIVREIVRAHGGSVDVTSSEVEGTTVSVRLPRG
jgi:signal transduction histidine kinase